MSVSSFFLKKLSGLTADQFDGEYMSLQPNFCEQCGAPSRPKARFCWQCGQPLLNPLSLQQNPNTAQAQRAIDMVICYAHEDEALRVGLIKQLYVLQRQGLITLWHDRDISAGKEWEHEIDVHLNEAQIILLLVSPDFIASDYCYSIEMQQALDRHKLGEACVIPVILRPVYWKGTPFGKLQALPIDGKPITAPNWGNIDEAFYSVAEGIHKLLGSFLGQVRNSDSQLVQNNEKSILTTREVYNSAKQMLQSVKYAGKLFGNYRLTRLLGVGGSAEVYLGEHIQSNMHAAVKIMEGPLMGTAAEDFLHEARNIARLVHPHIVRVLDIGLEEAIPFIIMDYAPNGSLRERYPKGTQLSLPTITLYIKQIADALQYAHDRRVLHRDLKPENILLGPRDEIWLSDFSLDVDTITKQDPLSAMAGTIPYMAPEQFNRKKGIGTDQYALGIIIYEWLCGYRPFSGSAMEIMTQHMVAPPPTLRDKVKIPSAVESVIMKALSKDMHRRFASMRDFTVAFEQASLSGT
jgi:Protein kinase domain/TIR domain